MAIFDKNFINNFNLKIINEENFYEDGNYIIGLDDSSSREYGLVKDPYIKIFKGKNRGSSRSDIRIRLKDGTSIIHNDGKDNLELNSNMKKMIIKAINGNCTIGKYKGLPVWDSIWEHLRILSIAHNTSIGIDYISLDTFIENFKRNN